MALLERPGELVARDDLRKKLWPSDIYVDFDRALNKAMVKLREALGDSAESPRYIETLPRLGYRFIAAINGRPRHQETVAAPSPNLHRRVLMVSGMLIILIAGAVWGWFRWRQRIGPQLAQVHSIAVLPLENLSHDPEQEYFADGMTEELVTELGKVAALRVISHTSVNRFKGTKKPLQEIARELQVDAIVEGTVLREGDRVRVTANLVQASPEKHLWSESYERDLGNVLDLQSEVARTIADRIKITVTPEERLRLSATQTVNPEAYELYLKGTFHDNKWTKEGFQRGIEYFNQALQKEPRNARAYAGLAVAYGGLGIYGDIAAYPKQKAAALKALAIDNTLAEAHNTLAWAKFTYDWDTAGAEQEFRRAIELNPSDARTHAWYGIFLAMQGRIEDSLQQVKSTRELDPLTLANTFLAYRTYYNARDYDKAIEVCRNALEMDPNFVPAHRRLVPVYEQTGELEKAIEERRRAGTIAGENEKVVAWEVHSLRKAYAEKGARGYWLQKLELLRADASGRDSLDIAVVYTRLGNKDEAFRWLERALQDRLPYLIWDLPANPNLDDLRSDPRYADLLRRLVPRSG